MDSSQLDSSNPECCHPASLATLISLMRRLSSFPSLSGWQASQPALYPLPAKKRGYHASGPRKNPSFTLRWAPGQAQLMTYEGHVLAPKDEQNESEPFSWEFN